MTAILQSRTPYDLGLERPLPGIAPLDPAQWLLVDEAYAAQMAERERLLTQRRPDVLAMTEAGRAGAGELLEHVLDWLDRHVPGFDVGKRRVRRPDGAEVSVDADDPMATLGRLVQEDFCLLQKQGDEHVLTAAVLCFPASWRLADKIGRPLVAIHAPVAAYDDGIARRVQRLFDGVRVDRPLWRFNLLAYADPALFQPVSRQASRVAEEGARYRYLRSERQCVLRLPRSQDCVFSIHTYVMARPVPDQTALAAIGKTSRSIE